MVTSITNTLFWKLKIIYKPRKTFLISLYHFKIFKLYNSIEFIRLCFFLRVSNELQKV